MADCLSREHGVRPRGLVRRLPEDDAPSYRPVVGDLEDRDSLKEAVAGCDAIFVVSPVHPQQGVLQENLLRAALASGGRPRIVKLSGLATRIDSFVDSGRWHAETEAAIAASGLFALFLRPYYFMQNLSLQLPAVRKSGVFRGVPDAARIAMVDVQDLAEVAARLLVDPPSDLPQALPVTGPQGLSASDVARILGEVLSRDVRCEPRSSEQLRSLLEQSGQPAWHVEILLQFNRAFAQGSAAEPCDTVERVLGRPARGLAAVAREFAAAG